MTSPWVGAARHITGCPGWRVNWHRQQEISDSADPWVEERDPAQAIDLVAKLTPQVRLLHLHLTDWLFVDAGVGADHIIAGLVRALRARGVALNVTLHDLPQPSDGPDLYRRRTATYRSLVESVAGVVVCSEHERMLLEDALVA